MNILLLNSFLYPRGGDTTCLFTQARALRAAGHRLIPFAMRHPDNLPVTEEAFFPPWNDPERPRPATLLGALWSTDAAERLERLLDQHTGDRAIHAAHAHHLHRHLSPSVLAVLRRRRVPTVWTLHDYELICPDGLLYTGGAPCTRCVGGHYEEAVRHRCKKGSLLQSGFVAMEKALHRRLRVAELPDRLICPSRFLLDRLREDGIATERLIHLPNPVELPALTGGPDPAPDPARPSLLMAGRLTPPKGVETLIRALRQLPGVALDVLGDGPERARLARELPAQIRWHGQRPVEEVSERIAGAAAVIVPSLWPENQPYAVLEAQARARPVVASRIGGIPEMIEDGRTGLLVPPGDAEALAVAIRRLLDRPQEAAAMGKLARQNVEKIHDPAQHAAQLIEIYGTL